MDKENIYSTAYYSAIKNELIICNNMNGPRGKMLSQISYTEEDKYFIILYVET